MHLMILRNFSSHVRLLANYNQTTLVKSDASRINFVLPHPPRTCVILRINAVTNSKQRGIKPHIFVVACFIIFERTCQISKLKAI